MANYGWHQRFTPRRILGRLQRELDAVLQRNWVIFFRCGPIEGAGRLRGELVEADPECYAQWRRANAEFPWPPPAEGARRFSDGHRPIALLVEGQVRCGGWVGTMKEFWLNELNGRCGTDIPMTWIWDCATPAAMRNQGYYTDFLRALRHRFRDRDLLIYSHARNASSVRAIRRAGFEPWVSVTRHPGGTDVRVLQPAFRGTLHADLQPH